MTLQELLAELLVKAGETDEEVSVTFAFGGQLYQDRIAKVGYSDGTLTLLTEDAMQLVRGQQLQKEL